MEELIECIEQVGNSPYDIKLYPKYIKLAGQQDNATVNEGADSASETERSDELGPLGAEACGTMTSAMAATSGQSLPVTLPVNGHQTTRYWNSCSI